MWIIWQMRFIKEAKIMLSIPGWPNKCATVIKNIVTK
jgi:hypothetical protein